VSCYFAPPPWRGMKYCDQHLCLYAYISLTHLCMSVWLHTSQATSPNFTKFSIQRYLQLWLSSPLTKMQYVMYFQCPGFVDDAMFTQCGTFHICNCDRLSDGIFELHVAAMSAILDCLVFLRHSVHMSPVSTRHCHSNINFENPHHLHKRKNRTVWKQILQPFC